MGLVVQRPNHVPPSQAKEKAEYTGFIVAWTNGMRDHSYTSVS